MKDLEDVSVTVAVQVVVWLMTMVEGEQTIAAAVSAGPQERC